MPSWSIRFSHICYKNFIVIELLHLNLVQEINNISGKQLYRILDGTDLRSKTNPSQDYRAQMTFFRGKVDIDGYPIEDNWGRCWWCNWEGVKETLEEDQVDPYIRMRPSDKTGE